jgi:hypothetical protein
LERERLIVVTGNYGSGKTEFSVNYVQHLHQKRAGVKIVDLDIVNPYFRCREARELLEEQGISVVAPRGGQAFSDLPIILPEVKGAILNREEVVLLDVGGDPEGARVLSSFGPSFRSLEGGYELLFVVNSSRPFTETKEGATKILREVEAASGLQVTGIISNAHLMDETTVETIVDGAKVATAVADDLGVEFKLIMAHEKFKAELGDSVDGVEVFYMQRLLLPPWKQEEAVGSQKFSLRNRRITI